MKKIDRLVQTFKPSHYNLKLDLDSQNLHFNGETEILGEVPRPTQTIKLHASGLDIESVAVSETNTLKGYKLDAKNQLLTLEFSEKIQPKTYTIKIKFSADITTSMVGVYPSYYDYRGKKQTILSTQLESHHAREVFPCIDEPEAKAKFDLTLITDDTTVISNTSPLDVINKDNRKITIFNTTPVMSTYLLAFTVGELRYIEAKTHSNVRVRVYSTPLHTDSLDFALQFAVKSLQVLEDYFDQPYVLDKCDLVALPDFSAGAMENWGLCIFRETALIYDPKTASLEDKKYVATVVAHELSHQWFGNLVTMKWWDDLWLNEGFARFMESYVPDVLHPEWKLWDEFVSFDFVNAQSLDRLNSTHAIQMSVEKPEDLRTAFDAISYDKGAAVIRMLNSYLGDEEFKKGLRLYIQRFKYDNAQSADLWETLEESSGLDIKKFMHDWTSNVGFPLLSITQSDDTYTYHQRRYRVTQDGSDDTLWPIPISLEGKSFSLTNAKGKLSTNKLTTTLNANHNGFYITKYDPETLSGFFTEDIFDKFLVTEKTGLLNDLFHLAKSGDSDVTLALERATVYAKEDSAAIIGSLISQLFGVKRILVENSSDELESSYSRFVHEILKDKYQSLGWQTSDDEPIDRRLIRPQVLGLLVATDYDDALKSALTMFESLSSVEDVKPSLLGVVLGAGAKHGGAKAYQKLWQLYETTKSPHSRDIIARSMTLSRDTASMEESFAKLGNGTIRLQDTPRWISGLFANPFSRQGAWQWLRKNWDDLRRRYGSDIMMTATLPMIAGSTLITSTQLHQYDEFFQTADMRYIEPKVSQGREMIVWKSDWRSRDQEILTAWLKERLTQ